MTNPILFLDSIKRASVKPVCFVLLVSFIQFIKSKLPFFGEREDKIAKYWKNQSRIDVIKNADQLFKEEKYTEIYERLNRIKHSRDMEVIWRIVQALYSLSLSPDITLEVRKEMLDEALDVLERTYAIGNGQSNYHKWVAIILNTRYGLENLKAKIEGYPIIRDQLTQACDSDPKDFAVQYMLGRWHFEMANLSWFQRKIAKHLYLEPPHSSFWKAYIHASQAEELRSRSFIPNMYVMGATCMRLGQHHRAKHYFQMALHSKPQTESEKYCTSRVKILLARMEKFDLGKDLILDACYNGFDG